MKTKKRLVLILLVIFLALSIHSNTRAEAPVSESSPAVQLQDDAQQGWEQESLDPYLERFNSYLRKRKYEKAIAEAKRMIEIAPEDLRGYSALKGTYARMGRYEDALKVSEKTNRALRTIGIPICGHVESHFRILQAAGRGEEAVEYLKAHRKECPKTVKYLTTLLEKGKSDEQRFDKLNVDAYSKSGTNLFWFVAISDTHIGWRPRDDFPSDNLIELAGNVTNTIRPKFIINTGDLTDQIWEGYSTLSLTNRKAQWARYRSILNCLNMPETISGVPKYTEAPGNHDQYFECRNSALANYKKYSIEGQSTKKTQQSWVLEVPPNKYHFVSVATPDPDKTDPIIDGYYDSPGLLSKEELDFLETTLENNNRVNHTFVFGHHVLKVNHWGVIGEGRDRLMGLLCDDKNKRGRRVSMYGHGHTHRDDLINPYYEHCKGSQHKVLAYNVPSLWEDSKYAVIAVDNDGISIKSVELHNWPVVLITTPINKSLGGINPNSYPIPRQPKNSIRALVFGKKEIKKVEYIIDDSAPGAMEQVADSNPFYPYLWEAEWNTSSIAPGPHTIKVVASESPISSSSDNIKIDIK